VDTIIQAGGGSVNIIQEGSGRDLVLLPTLLADISVYGEVIAELSKSRRVTRINFPGFGGSTSVGPQVADYAKRVSDTMDALDIPNNCDLLGNGFGGFVAGTLAISQTDRIDRLVLVDTGAGFPDLAKQPLRILAGKVREGGMESVLDAAVKRMFPEPFIGERPDIIENRKKRLATTDPEMFASAAEALVDLDNRANLAKIKNPTLVVVGLEDQTTPPALSDELVEGISGAEFIGLPGIGHCPQLQDPEVFLNAVCPFLGIQRV
jgi:3-oxoadipate enol-lactonase